jgi:hypothetical protein
MPTQARSKMISATLSGLPVELLREIQSLLPYASQLALRITCRDLYSESSRPSTVYQMVDLLAIETWPQYNDAMQRPAHLKQPIAGLDFFSCSRCLRIRSACYFSNAMMKGKRGKSASPRDKLGRICIQCGMASGQYRKGVSMMYGGAPVSGIMEHTGVVCPYCEEFHSVCEACRDNNTHGLGSGNKD